jgi:hypothetical protein
MRLSTSWHQSLAEMGNAPGVDRGDVTIFLAEPVEHRKSWTVASGAVVVSAEAGNITGLEVTLPDGRRLFLLAANVLGIIDAAEEGAE